MENTRVSERMNTTGNSTNTLNLDTLIDTQIHSELSKASDITNTKLLIMEYVLYW